MSDGKLDSTSDSATEDAFSREENGGREPPTSDQCVSESGDSTRSWSGREGERATNIGTGACSGLGDEGCVEAGVMNGEAVNVTDRAVPAAPGDLRSMWRYELLGETGGGVNCVGLVAERVPPNPDRANESPSEGVEDSESNNTWDDVVGPGGKVIKLLSCSSWSISTSPNDPPSLDPLPSLWIVGFRCLNPLASLHSLVSGATDLVKSVEAREGAASLLWRARWSLSSSEWDDEEWMELS